MLGKVAEGLTLAKNFGPWFGGLAIIAFVAGVVAGGFGSKLFYQGRALTAERNLAQFESRLSAETAAAEQRAGQRQLEALQIVLDDNEKKTRAINEIPERVAKLIGPTLIELRKDLNAPEYDCLRTVPLPDAALERLSRPGGAAAGDR